MKRMISGVLVLVLVLIVAMGCAVAESEEKTLREKAEDIKDYAYFRMYAYYRIWGDDLTTLSDTNAMALFFYYQMYEGGRGAHAAETFSDYRRATGAEAFGDAERAAEKGNSDLFMMVASKWNEWMDGKCTADEFKTLLAIVVKSIVRAHEAAK